MERNEQLRYFEIKIELGYIIVYMDVDIKKVKIKDFKSVGLIAKRGCFVGQEEFSLGSDVFP